MNPISNKKGFTLIELLIVITIIGILAVAFLPSLLGAPAKARDTQRVADIQKIAGVLTNMTISGDITGGCVDGSDLGGQLSAADFGGALPDDPSDSTTIGSADCNGYLVLAGDRSDTTNDYAFGVFGVLENSEQSNFDCTIVDGQDGSTAVVLDAEASSGAYVTEAGAGHNCYAVLVQ